jgi:hypothetical protein
MTWFADVTENRPDDAKREKLLAERVSLEAQILTLKKAPLGKTQAAARFRLEDLTALASKIKNIDKRLGRTFA